MSTNRRQFLSMAGFGLASFGISTIPRRAFAIDNDQVLLTVFLRGGADGMSILHPAPTSDGVTSAARAKYESWRATNTRIKNGIPIGRFAMHPALEPLTSALNARHLMILGGVGGAQFNRSHFEQQDLVETGAGSTGAPLPDGLLGRALEGLGREDSVLSAVSLNETPPQSLKQSFVQGLSVPSFRSFGKLSSLTHKPDEASVLEARVDRLYVSGSGVCPANAVLCENGQRAAQAIIGVNGLRLAAGLDSVPAPTSLGGILSDLVRLVAVDSSRSFKFITLDVGGWDTHLEQGNDDHSGTAFVGNLARNLSSLAGALSEMYTRAQDLGVWNRMNVLVLTEFGRTTRQNGTAGTDHGFGGAALLMGTRLARKITAPNYFPTSASHAFYSQAESINVVPRGIEHRQLFSEVLTRRLGVDDLSSVLPGFTPDPNVPGLYT